MYLKKVIMHGFKSFADKTEIIFEDDITAIVGPNGSGKSNVSDAIKWVLGEQSAKSLRGERMQDIIFSGTSSRNALGFAEVTLVFNNEEKIIPIEYSEVSITRRMFRSGESEFYINKSACRLKDIRELLMDTGLGKDGYSIIEQGRIDKILSEKSEDRRYIFEEAAGIVKYRSRKMETERKLERTKDNLLRIEDLTSEIKRQYERLKKSSQKAIEYKRLYNELKYIEINIYNIDKKSYLEKINNKKNILKNKQLDLEKLKEELKDKSNTFNRLESYLSKLKKNLDKKQLELFNLSNKKIKNENEVRLLEERLKFEVQEIDKIKENIKSLEESKKEKEDDLEKTKEELVNYNIKFNNIKDEIGQINDKIQEINDVSDDKNKVLNNLDLKLKKLYNMELEYSTEIRSSENIDKNIGERLEKIDFDIEKLRESIEELRSKIKVKKISLQDKKDENKKIKDEIKLLKDQKDLNEKNIDELYERLKNKDISFKNNLSSYNIYKNMEDDYDGYYKGVKNLLLAIDNRKISKDGFIGVVADLIKVEDKYATAINTTLGGSIQNVVTRKDKDAQRMIEYLKKFNLGRVTFLPLSSIKGRSININLNKYNLEDYGVLGIASDLVEYDKDYDNLILYLLGRTLVVNNLDNGLKLSKDTGYSHRIVTLEGDLLNPGGSITGGSYRNKNLNLINRRNKIEKLKKNIKKEKEELKKINIKYRQEKEMNKKIIQDLNFKLELTKELDLELIKIENNISILQNEYDRNQNELNNLKTEKEMLDKEVINTINNKKENISLLYKLKNEKKEIDKKVYVLKDHLNKISIKKGRLNEEKNIVNIKLNDYQNKLNLFNDNIEKLSKEIKNIDKKISVNKEDISSSSLNIEYITRQKHDLAILLEDIKYKSCKLEENISKLEDEYNRDIFKLEKLKDNLSKINKDVNDRTNNINSIELEISKLNILLDNIVQKFNEKYNIEDKNLNDFLKADIDYSKYKENSIIISKKIKKLGSVDLDSIKEFEEVKNRYEFLENQKNDLVESSQNLKKIIKDLEIEMEKKFLNSLNLINNNFKNIFKILFEGGVAELELEDKDNILESGILIKAQPPGKKLQNINLLSGGEKSLTAVALLFSILEMKPTPFCVLDEIDAALDEANIDRYTEYLKSLTKKTQFILITHRKTTMEISDSLYGVTMQNKGVSKLYSVKMKDYISK